MSSKAIRSVAWNTLLYFLLSIYVFVMSQSLSGMISEALVWAEPSRYVTSNHKCHQVVTASWQLAIL